MKKKFRIVVSIFVDKNFAQLKEKIKIAKLEGADVVELRADSYPKIIENDLLKLKGISNNLKIPIIFTLRSREEGGKHNFSFEKKLKLLKKAIDLNFEYIDIELKFLQRLGKNVPDLKGNSKTKIILSFHNLKGAETLEGLRQIKKRIASLKPDVIKLAVFSRSEKTNQDILKIIGETKREGKHKFLFRNFSNFEIKNIIGIALGEKGKDARLKAIPENYFSYFCLNEKEKTAPGQISLAEFNYLKN
jgi:3-dehydroquinate dehydratase/shikimate dehydrogenase